MYLPIVSPHTVSCFFAPPVVSYLLFFALRLSCGSLLLFSLTKTCSTRFWCVPAPPCNRLQGITTPGKATHCRHYVTSSPVSPPSFCLCITTLTNSSSCCIMFHSVAHILLSHSPCLPAFHYMLTHFARPSPLHPPSTRFPLFSRLPSASSRRPTPQAASTDPTITAEHLTQDVAPLLLAPPFRASWMRRRARRSTAHC